MTITAGGIAITRLIEQMAPWPAADLVLASLGTTLFLLFIPSYIAHLRERGAEGGQSLATGLLLGISLDTAIKGAFSTLDLSWHPGSAGHLTIAGLVTTQWLVLWGVVGRGDAKASNLSPIPRSWPVVALGPILFLELLLYQNIGQQTVLIGWDQPQVFAWIGLANVAGIVAATLVVAHPRHGNWVTRAALAGLFALTLLVEFSGLTAAATMLFGQVTLAMALAVVAVATVPGASGIPDLGEVTGGAGLRSRKIFTDSSGYGAASALGMLLLLFFLFLYYGNYQLNIPGGNSIVAPLAVAIVILCVLGATTRVSKRAGVTPYWAPSGAAALLIVIPLGYMAAWEEPESNPPSGLPVRVMSYNLHRGFNADGRLAINDLIEVIKDQEPDIVALQEVSRGWVIDGSFDMLVSVSQKLDMPYVWGPAADSVWGNAILSRYPMHDPQTRPMPNNNRLQMDRSFTTVQVELGNGESLTVHTTHLHNFLEEGQEREPQVRAILEEWNGQVMSVIMGDLNSLPDSVEMRMLEESGLLDTFVIASPGIQDEQVGYTYHSNNPSRRIDYIWASSDLRPSDFALSGGTASDHLGVAVTLDR